MKAGSPGQARVQDEVVAAVGAHLRPARHPLTDEARALQRALLGDVGHVRRGLDPMDPAPMQGHGQQRLGDRADARVRARRRAATPRC